MRNRGVIRGVDASIARRTAQLTRLLPPTSRSVLSLSVQPLSPATHTRPRDSITFSTSTNFLSSLSLSSLFLLPRTRACTRARTGECERTYGRSTLADVFKNVGSGPRGSASLTGSVSTFAPRTVSIRTNRVEVKVEFAPLKVIEDDGWIESSLLFSCESFLE